MKAAAAFGVLVAFVILLGVVALSPWESDSDGEGGGFGGDDGNQEEQFVPRFQPGSTVMPGTETTPVLPLGPEQPASP